MACLTRRGGLRGHTRRIDDAGGACARRACIFNALEGHRAPSGISFLQDRACIGAIHAVSHGSGMPLSVRVTDRYTHRYTRPGTNIRTDTRGNTGKTPTDTRSDTRALRGISRGWRPLSATDTRAPCAGFRGLQPEPVRTGAIFAQSAASRRSASWKERASATSLSSSSPRPSRTIAPRRAVARNRVQRNIRSIGGAIEPATGADSALFGVRLVVGQGGALDLLPHRFREADAPRLADIAHLSGCVFVRGGLVPVVFAHPPAPLRPLIGVFRAPHGAPDTACARRNGGGRARVSVSTANERPAFRQSAHRRKGPRRGLQTTCPSPCRDTVSGSPSPGTGGA